MPDEDLAQVFRVLDFETIGGGGVDGLLVVEPFND